MSGVRPLARVLRYAALSGFQDFGATYTVWSWSFGLFLRMMTQVAFFASIGLQGHRTVGTARREF